MHQCIFVRSAPSRTPSDASSAQTMPAARGRCLRASSCAPRSRKTHLRVCDTTSAHGRIHVSAKPKCAPPPEGAFARLWRRCCLAAPSPGSPHRVAASSFGPNSGCPPRHRPVRRRCALGRLRRLHLHGSLPGGGGAAAPQRRVAGSCVIGLLLHLQELEGPCRRGPRPAARAAFERLPGAAPHHSAGAGACCVRLGNAPFVRPCSQIPTNRLSD